MICNEVSERLFGAAVSRGQSRWERFPGGNQPVPGHQHLGGLLARAGAEFDPGGVEIAVHGLGGDAEPQGDLLAAVDMRFIASDKELLKAAQAEGFDVWDPAS